MFGLLIPVARLASCFFSSSIGYRVLHPCAAFTAPNGVHVVQGPVGAPLLSATAALTHSTHAHSAEAGTAENDRESATSNGIVGASRIRRPLFLESFNQLQRMGAALVLIADTGQRIPSVEAVDAATGEQIESIRPRAAGKHPKTSFDLVVDHDTPLSISRMGIWGRFLGSLAEALRLRAPEVERSPPRTCLEGDRKGCCHV